MELPDAGLQADDVLMARLDLIQSLARDLGVGDDLYREEEVQVETFMMWQNNPQSCNRVEGNECKNSIHFYTYIS